MVTARGFAQWDYFSRAPHSHSEVWFSNSTTDGDADKPGYMDLLDSYGDYGFYGEDMWMNALGSFAGYYLF